MDNAWKNSLRERFSDYAAPEPEGLWEGIEQGIAGKPRRKMLPVWLLSGLAAAAAVALVVFLPTRKAVEPKTPDLDHSLESVLAEAVPADTTAPSSQAPTGDPEVAQAASRSVPFAVASRRTLLAEAEPIVSVPVSEETVPEAVPEIVPETVPENVPVAEPPVEQKDSPKSVKEALESIVPSLEITPGPASARNRFSVGAYGNGGQAAREELKGYGMNRTGAYLNTRTIGGNSQNDVGDMIRMLAANKASNFEVHHAAPLRVGLTAAYGLTSHLSLVSGLNWTYLNSEFVETSDPMRTVTNQDLGYLGIPLRLEAGTHLGKNLWVYAGAGGMVEKGLMSASRTLSWVEGQQKESTDNPKPDTGGLLWSVGATAGAEYRFSPAFGLYVSPGIEYHFDNGSPVRSAYTEKPLHWNVNLGARFHFGI